MSDPVTCHVCGARVPLDATEAAHTGSGVKRVCVDGYACARRANGLTLTVVTP